MPDKLRELQELFLVQAQKYNVFPLNNALAQLLLTPRPSATAGRDLFTYSGEISGLPSSDAPSILNRSYTITAEVEVPQDGGEGMLVTLGGPLRWIRFVSVEGQASVPLQLLGYGAVPLGWPRASGAGQTHHRV